jgi:hypothetical protein
MLPVPPPDLSNIFDMSDLPPIPLGAYQPLVDGAVEAWGDDDPSVSRRLDDDVFFTAQGHHTDTIFHDATSQPSSLPSNPKPTDPPNPTAPTSDVLSLLSHLSLHHSLRAHYDADLAARDALVHELSARLAKAEQSLSRRRALAKAWAAKVERLKCACRSLEEEVQRGREDSAERGGEEVWELRERVRVLEREREEGRERVRELEAVIESRWQDDAASSTSSPPNDDQATRVLETQHAVLKAELEAQWRYMEEATEKIQTLEEENRRLGQVVARLGPEADRAKADADKVTIERDQVRHSSFLPLPV